MAVSHDASTESHTGTTASTGEASFSWSHGGASSGVKGVLVFTFNNTSTTAISTGVTYGGSALTAVTGGAAVDSAGEQGRCTAWFLGTSVPQGTQTVVVDRVNNAAVIYAVAITVLAAADTETNGVVLLQGDQALAEQNVDDGSPGSNSLRYAGTFSGLPTPPAAGANSTALHSIDLGALGDAAVRETTAGQGSRPVGFSASTDDVAAVHLAIREQVPGVALAVTAGADDGYSYSGSFLNSGIDLYVGDVSGGTQPVGSFLRFVNVTIPQGATITSAVVEIRTTAGAGTAANVDTRIRANDVDNATAPTSIATFDALARTTASVNYDPATWPAAGSTVFLPDISSVIQAIVNRAGWVSGNALMLLWERRATASGDYIGAASFDHTTSQEPRLVILYTVSSGATGTVAVTQADQTSAATGVETFTATSAQTQADQTSTASGSVANPVTGTVAVTQADQTSTAAGVETFTGTVAVTQADQTSTASGSETITGTSATTQADQTSTATGVFGDAVSGTVAVTQADQTSTASGSIVLTIVGTVAVVQADQTSTATAVETFTGTSANVQADQTSTATGTALVAVTGTVAVTQDNQFSTASGFFGQLTFWSTNPAGYTANPAAFVRVGAGDTPPAW